MRIVDYICSHGADCAGKCAVICGNESVAYKEFADAIRSRAAALVSASGRKGRRSVVFRASQDIAFLVEYFAIHLAGLVAVPLEKDESDERMEQIIAMVSEAAIPDNVADILFTTGTTGMSKGVMISHRAIVSNAENLIDGQKFTPELTFIIAGPLNHIGSLSKLYPVFLQGGTIIISEGLKDMNSFYETLSLPARKMGTFLVPSAIRMLLKFSAGRLAEFADKIDFIETGAAPISQDDMQQLCAVLPKSRLYNTYASTETGIIATYNYNDSECIAGCLGLPMRHSRISFDSEGHIVCKGSTLMSGYVGNEDLTATVLYDDAVHTQDLGCLDCEGRLRLQGRDGDVINVGGLKVAPAEVEEMTMRLKGVSDCICIGIDHPITGKALKLLVVLDHSANLSHRDVAAYLKHNLVSYKVPLFYESVGHIERTYNGKLNRKAYYKTAK